MRAYDIVAAALPPASRCPVMTGLPALAGSPLDPDGLLAAHPLVLPGDARITCGLVEAQSPLRTPMRLTSLATRP